MKKKRIQKMFLFLVSLTLVLSLFSFGTFAEEALTEEAAAVIEEQPEEAAPELSVPAVEDAAEKAVEQSVEAEAKEQPEEEKAEAQSEEAESEEAEPEDSAQAPEEAASEEAAPEEQQPEEAAEPAILEEGEVSVEPDITGSSDELLTDYIEVSLGTSNNAMYAAQPVGKKLTGVNLAAYNVLKQWAAKVAKGEITNTIINLTSKDMGLKDSYTAAELGVSSLGTNGEVSDEAVNALRGLLPDILKVNLAMLFDMPYEMYWYDKSIDGALTYQFSINNTKTADGRITSVSIPAMTWRFTVAEEYADKSKGKTEVDVDGKAHQNYFNLDKTKLSTVQTALKTIKSIVDANASKSAYEKLKAYKDKVDELATYHPTAMKDPAFPYGNPWQLIWVFDGNPETKVVCEGYSKAFQYLCDLSSLGKVTVRTVTGSMTSSSGTENHMWNLVTMEDGKNYVVDATNCDEGTVGYPDKLFLAGGGGSGKMDYVIAGVGYTYGNDSKNSYTPQELLVSRTYYGSNGPVPTAKELVAFDKSGGNQLVEGKSKDVKLVVSNLNPDYAYPSITLNVGPYNKKTDKFDFVFEMGTDYKIVQTKEGFTLSFTYDAVKKAYKAKGRNDSVLSLFAQLTDNDGKVLTKDFYSLTLVDKNYTKKVAQAKVTASGTRSSKELEESNLVEQLEANDNMGVSEDVLFDSIDMDQIWEKILANLPEDLAEDAQIELNLYFEVDAESLTIDEDTDDTTLVMDINLVYEVVLKADGDSEGVVIDTGDAILTEPVDLMIPVDDLFEGTKDPSSIYIQHVHEGNAYVYQGTLVTDQTGTFVKFRNPNGFSKFTITNFDPNKKPDAPVNPAEGNGKPAAQVKPAAGTSVKTGDENHAEIWIVLMAAALVLGAGGAAAVLIRKKKNL